MKKKLALLLVGCMMVSLLTACGKDKENDAQDSTQNSTQNQVETDGTSASEGETEFLPGVEAENLADVKVEDYVTMGEYKNLKMSFAKKGTYTEEEVEALALSVYQDYVTSADEAITDRAAVLGDTVNIDYTGVMVGETEPFAGGSTNGAGAALELGSGSYIDGFEEGLVGVKPGETVDLNLNFPDPYYNDETKSGKAVVFTVTMNYIYPTEASQMKDSVIVNMGSAYYDTVDEFITYCREYIEYSLNDTYVTGKQNAALTALLEVAEVSEAPEGLVKKYYDSIYASLASQAAMYGMDADTLCTYFYGTDAVTYASMYAEESAKQSMIVQYVANAENLNISDKELDECIERFAEENKVSADEVRATDDEEMLREYFMFEKVLNFIVDNGIVIETDGTEVTE